MKARFIARFIKPFPPGSSARAIRTFKGTITVEEEGDHFVDAVIGALHGIAKEENLTSISQIQLTASIIQRHRK
ncbi:hypothetical protein OpiT1DRAFT_04010 [Opitutaceae bacterium TAV1]|nr:hypothetical protein OpiT1DRAFT_04010 [Opitutaceae bacterium TAV1]